MLPLEIQSMKLIVVRTTGMVTIYRIQSFHLFVNKFMYWKRQQGINQILKFEHFREKDGLQLHGFTIAIKKMDVI